MIDDDEDDLFILDQTIKNHFQHIKFIGFQHFDSLYSCLDEIDPQQIKAIFIDLNMPKVNGIEVLRKLRSDQRFKNTSKLIYSTSNNPNDINQSLKEGADAFIVKPSKIEDLVSEIEPFLN